jgi:hypothetical protein
MNKDHLLAILAMDSYNRGYSQHIDDMDDPDIIARSIKPNG